MKNIVLIITIFLLSLLLVATAYILKNEQICCNFQLCRQFTDICIKEEEVEDIPTVKVFFSSNKIDSTRTDCSLVFPVSREIDNEDIERATLNELFKGLTEQEVENGYFTDIPEGVEIKSLNISDGIARVDLSNELELGVSGSCRVIGIRAQIEETLKQFNTVESVLISIDGKTEDILQP